MTILVIRRDQDFHPEFGFMLTVIEKENKIGSSGL